MEENKLIEKCKQGDQSAQKSLFEQHSPQLFGVCLRYCNTRVEAEDIFQEGFVTIFDKLDQYKSEGSLAGWMRRVMVTTALMYHRKMKGKGHTVELTDAAENKYNESELEVADPDPGDIKAIIEKADFSREELLSVTNDLPDGYRMVFNLVVVEGYKHREAADMLGISESTSKTQLLKARKVLQKMLHQVALEKNKIRKPERALALAFIVMEGDLNYIDEILKDGLGNLQVTPPTDWAGISGHVAEQAVSSGSGTASSIANSGIQHGTGIVAKISTSVVKFATTQMHTVATMFVATTFSLGVFTQSTGPADPNMLGAYAAIPVVEQTEEEQAMESELLQKENVQLNAPTTIEKQIKPSTATNRIEPEPVVIDTITVPVKREKVIMIKKKVVIKDTVVIEKRMRH